MAQYIKKSEIVAEIEKRTKETESLPPTFDQFWAGQISAFKGILKILDTLEVKEIHEDIDLDLNPIFEEFDIDPDSRFASMFKEGFYKGVDRYLNKKEGKV